MFEMFVKDLKRYSSFTRRNVLAPAPEVKHMLSISQHCWLRLKRNLHGLEEALGNWFSTYQVVDQGQQVCGSQYP
jgi:hypothetical protein